MPDDADLVTVAEAARRLGVDPRQVRRYLPRLKPEDIGQDTQRTHKGQPIVLVRLSAVEALRTGANESESTTDTRNGQDTGQPKDRTGHVRSADSALVEQLRSENEYLRAALTREQETARAALSELSEFRRQAAVMIAATATGQIVGADPAQNTPQEASGGDSTGDRAEGGADIPPDASEGKGTGFWARLFGRRNEAK